MTIQDGQVNEAEAPEVQVPAVETPAAADEQQAAAAAPTEPPAKTDKEKSEPKADLSVAEKIAAKAAELAAKKEKEKPASETPASGAAAAEKTAETPEPAIDAKFKAGVYNKETKEIESKEFEIDKRFHSLMKDPETAKLVRELHEKAYGLDSVKERLNESKTFATQLQRENGEIKSGIDGLRKIYQKAVQEQNPHKLDSFFAKLRIPQDVIMAYAVAKAELNEMDPAQRNAILGQIHAEQRAEQLAEQQEQFSQQTIAQQQEMKRVMLDTTLQRPEISSLAQAWDQQTGRPGSFREEVVRTGQLAYHQEDADLTPEQAIQRVIQRYNLTTKPVIPGAVTQQQPAAAATPAPTPSGAPAKVVVQRTTQTLPNVASKGAQSPLKDKPRSVEDLKKLYKEQYQNQ